MSVSKTLEQLIDKFEYLQAIIISDKEGIEIFSAYSLDGKKIKENYLIFVAAFSQSNDNLTKLDQGKAKSITHVYEDFILFQENWDAIILSIWSKPNGNIGLIYQIAKSLRIPCTQIEDKVDKIAKSKE